MKKSKGQTIDLLYTNQKEVNKKAKSKPKTTTNEKQNNCRGRTPGRPAKQNNSNELINLDNEIIIGLTPKKEEIKKPANQKREKTKKNVKSKSNSSKQVKNKETNKKADRSTNKTSKKNKAPKKEKNLKIVKWTSIIILLAGAITLFMMSSVFNIKQIVVLNNNKISSQEIINLSTLTPEINMFKTTKATIKDNIKTNAYIEDVKISRNINGTITLDIKERKPTYMLKFANAYVYINNQGYMLEVSETPLELPVITGFSTPEEEIKAGNRLSVEDLKKLDDVIKIMESAKNNPLEYKEGTLASIITEIDISNSMNYKLTIESEGKTVQFGEAKEINVKLGRITIILKAEKGKRGEIYFQSNEKDKSIFREEVSR